jgi:NAD(P)-dependent dehydrogenase (short-subunit alcohol dehydrogenase family)
MTGLRYADKAVIVTGGSSGIGKGCAYEFVRAGAKVVICCNNEEEGSAAARDLQNLAREQGAGEAGFVYCDVRKAEDLRRLIETTVSRYGRLDCLVNNAGWHPPHRPIDDFSVEDFRALLELNLVSAFTACKLALPHLRRTRGNIINMSSLVAQIGQYRATTYVATKGALTSFTKALAIDEAGGGVRVNSISPGNVFTPLWQQAVEDAADPVRRLGRPGAPPRRGRGGSGFGAHGDGGGGRAAVPVHRRRGDIHDRRGSHHFGRGRARLWEQERAGGGRNILRARVRGG